MKNEWVDIKGFEGIYQINISGQIKSLSRLVNSYQCEARRTKERILKNSLTPYGYYSVGLHNKRKIKKFLVHRLVAIHFMPNPDKHPQINHIDGIKTNNDISNLEWCTCDHNVKHAFKNGLIPKKINPKGERGMSAKLTDNQAREIKKRLSVGERIADIVIDYPVKKSAIDEIKAGRSWGHI